MIGEKMSKAQLAVRRRKVFYDDILDSGDDQRGWWAEYYSGRLWHGKKRTYDHLALGRTLEWIGAERCDKCRIGDRYDSVRGFTTSYEKEWWDKPYPHPAYWSHKR